MNGYYVLALGFLAICVAQSQIEEKGCAATGLCCRGRNNKCKVKGKRMNGKSNKTCFCDESCLFLGDCCTDFRETCRAQSCILGEWERYSECSASCGLGVKTRKRPVLQEPLYGGKGCDTTEEKIYCNGEKCKYPRHSMGHLEIRETGKIIPAEFGTWRASKLFDPYKDIRRNLFNHYSAKDIIRRPAYCATFEITKAKSSCAAGADASNPWGSLLDVGQTVCVECQPFAMKRSIGVRCQGHGVYMRESRWNALTVPGCHGKWIMKTRHEDCSCPANKQTSFIFI